MTAKLHESNSDSVTLAVAHGQDRWNGLLVAGLGHCYRLCIWDKLQYIYPKASLPTFPPWFLYVNNDRQSLPGGEGRIGCWLSLNY